MLLTYRLKKYKNNKIYLIKTFKHNKLYSYLNSIVLSHINYCNNLFEFNKLISYGSLQNDINFSYFMNLYFNNYIIHKLGQQSVLVFNNLNLIINNSNYYINLLKKKIIKNKNYNFYYISNVINCLLLSLYFKDSSIFMNNIIKLFETSFYKNHRKILVMLRYLLKLSTQLFFFFNILGILFRAKGKIGLGGNSKKKKIKLIFNKLKLNNKNIKLCYSNNRARTDSGVLGLNYILTYN